jgi:hypothetical protein
MNQSCEITPSNRNCRWCRYQKCLRVGMAIEGAKLGRKPNIVKKNLIDANKHKKRAYFEDEDSNDSELVVVDDNDTFEPNSKRAKFDGPGSVEASPDSDVSFKSGSFTFSDSSNMSAKSAVSSLNNHQNSYYSSTTLPQNHYISYAYNYLNSGLRTYENYPYTSYLPNSTLSHLNMNFHQSDSASTNSYYNYQ